MYENNFTQTICTDPTLLQINLIFAQEIHPVIREVVGYGEGAALRSAKIGEYILVTVRVDRVTNKIDSIAYGGFMKVENTGISVSWYIS